MFGIEQKIERAACKGAAFSAAALFGVAGLGFLTTAAWMVLSEVRSELFAAGVIGAVYIGIAAIAVAIGLGDPQTVKGKTDQPNPADMTPLQLVVLSFVQGFEQGRQKDRAA